MGNEKIIAIFLYVGTILFFFGGHFPGGFSAAAHTVTWIGMSVVRYQFIDHCG